MFPFPEKLRKEHEQWRKDNPEQAKELDDEVDAVMNKLIAHSEAKYGKQRPGIYRIDPDFFKKVHK